MIMYKQDSDVVRWGIHLLQGDMSTSEFCGTATQGDVTCYDREYRQETNIDLDVVRWGIHLLQGDMSTSEFCGTATQGDVTCYDREYPQETNIGTVHTVALQEELSHVVVAEASERSHDSEDHSQASVLVQDRFRPTVTKLWSGSQDIHGGPREKANEEELFQLEIIDENASLDGEVGKRLNHVAPIPDLKNGKTVGRGHVVGGLYLFDMNSSVDVSA